MISWQDVSMNGHSGRRKLFSYSEHRWNMCFCQTDEEIQSRRMIAPLKAEDKAEMKWSCNTAERYLQIFSLSRETCSLIQLHFIQPHVEPTGLQLFSRLCRKLFQDILGKWKLVPQGKANSA